jgi:uncharacterized protein
MLMEEVFDRLRNFQEILTKRVGIEREVEDIPKALVAQEEVLSRVKKSFTERHEAFETAEALVKDLRGQLQAAETTREAAEKQMDAISTQREYEALNKEIRDATDHEHELRKDLQREEHNLSEIEEAMRKDESMIKLQETEIGEKSTKISAEKESKLAEIASLKKEEEKASLGIEKNILFKFERIIRSKQGLGIVPVKGYVCSGCHMVLPAQFVNEVRQGNKIIFCPYCSRVLYYEESDEEEGNQLLVDIESGSLSDLSDYAEEGEEEEEGEGYEEGEKDPSMDESDE